ncbi:DUF1836 domain-containing protein [Clostridium sp.]|uniref:DUF1836 domain-containing protein n=1 Tax=Clostridium sp. TaxID=1506 RepID=UPI00260CD161|nr:DUF1836 domain-containing protein [Clostridium sp.]
MNLSCLIDELKLDKTIKLNDIPELDLYMDQVIQLFENEFAETKRFEDDKILTKTMINNYAKGKLLMDIKNKKYSKEHIILMSLIYNMKGILALNDIKLALGDIVERYNKEEVSKEEIRNLYNLYLLGHEKNISDIKESLNIHIDNLGDGFKDLEKNEKKMLLASILVDKANMYKRIAEKILDEE